MSDAQPECVHPGTREELDDLIERVATAPARCGAVKVVCIDGPAGAGKTELAGRVGAALSAPVVHLDDIYEGWHQELGDSLAARLDAWLLSAWAAGLPGRYLRYDWALGRFVEWVSVPPAPVVILEGCGSGSSSIRSRAALLIWVIAPPESRLARGLDRDGNHLTEEWLGWQVREAAHFAADGTADAADLIMCGHDEDGSHDPVTRDLVTRDPATRDQVSTDPSVP